MLCHEGQTEKPTPHLQELYASLLAASWFRSTRDFAVEKGGRKLACASLALMQAADLPVRLLLRALSSASTASNSTFIASNSPCRMRSSHFVMGGGGGDGFATAHHNCSSEITETMQWQSGPFGCHLTSPEGLFLSIVLAIANENSHFLSPFHLQNVTIDGGIQNHSNPGKHKFRLQGGWGREGEGGGEGKGRGGGELPTCATLALLCRICRVLPPSVPRRGALNERDAG